MKKIILIIFLLIVSSVAAVETNTPIIEMSAESITPYPVEPGQDFSIQLRVYNYGEASANGIRLNYVPNDQFTLTGKDENFDDSFGLCSSCSKDMLFYFTVSPDAVSSEYPLKFKATVDDTDYDETVFIRVIGKPDLIVSAQLEDKQVSPGDKATMKLVVKNVGTGNARNVKIVPGSDDFVMENENLVFIDEIKPGRSVIKDISFIVSDSIQPSVHKVPLTLSYNDEKSEGYSDTVYVGFDIINDVKMDISAVSFSPRLLKMNEEVELIVRVENLGQGSADNIKIHIEDQDQKWQEVSYLGKLDEDEDAPAYFSLRTSAVPGNSDMKITIDYIDDNGSHEITETVPIKVHATRSFSDILLYAVLATGVLAVGYLVLRKKKKSS